MRALALAAGLCIAATPQLPNSIPAADASKHVGQQQIVCGPVAGVRREDAATLFDLVQAHPNQAVTVSVARGVAAQFPKDFESRTLDVCATGVIQTSHVIQIDEAKNIRGFHRVAAGAAKPDLAGIVPPRVTREGRPRYTNEAMRAGIQGTVEIEMEIGTNGEPGKLRFVKSLDALFGLDDEAMRVAGQWRFEPARREGFPIPFTAVIQLEFRLDPHRTTPVRPVR